MRKLLSILLAVVLALSLTCGAFASGEASDESSDSSSDATVTASAAADPDRAIELDGVAMGQVQHLITTAAVAYDGGASDELHSTGAGVTVENGVTSIVSDEENYVGVAIRNTGAFVLGGASDPALVAEKINFSYITSSYYPDWEAFCRELGYDASMSLEEIAAALVADGSTARYTNLGLAAPDTVILRDYSIDLSGAGTNDMGGFGAAVYVSDNAVAELNNFRTITRGPGRGTLFTRFGAVVTVNGSTFYAVSGKFALYEFLKVFIAFALAVSLLAISPVKEKITGRFIAMVLAVCSTLGSLVSIDLINKTFTLYEDFRPAFTSTFGDGMDDILSLCTENTFMVGQDVTGKYSSKLNAALDEVMIFNAALTIDDVEELRLYYTSY